MNESKVVSYGALALTERKRAKTAEANRKLAQERDANAKALAAGGFQERSGARFVPETEGWNKGRSPQFTPQSNIPVVSPACMQRATIAYRKFHVEKDQKQRRQFGADFGNALGFDLSTVRQAYDLIHSAEAKAAFGESE